MTTTSIYDRFDRMLETHAPSLLPHLRPPATAADINEAERLMGMVFPDDLRQAYLWHDGYHAGSDDVVDGLLPSLALFGCGGEWVPLRHVLRCWREDRESERQWRLEELGLPLGESDYFPDYGGQAWRDRMIRPWVECEGWFPVGRYGLRSLRTYCDLWPGGAGKLGQLFVYDPVDDHYSAEVVFASSFNEHLTRVINAVEQGRIRFGKLTWVEMASFNPEDSDEGEVFYLNNLGKPNTPQV